MKSNKKPVMSVLVSVIIPAYNAEIYIARALDSVLSQSYPNIEVIVINDGSTDRTENIVKSYGSEVLYISKSNSGVSSTRNIGIKEAKGEYIAFLDCDDIWHRKKIEIQMTAMFKVPSAVASYTNTAFHSAQEIEKPAIYEAQAIQIKNTLDIFKKQYLVTSSFLVKKEILNKTNGFDESLITAEDIDLYLKVATFGNILFINTPITFKDKVDGSLGAQLRSYSDNLDVIDSFFKRNPNLTIDFSSENNKIKSRIHSDWAKDLMWRQMDKEAIEKLIYSLRYKLKLSTFKLLLKSLVKALFMKKKVE
jgi:glycosyltransferase involved in cell wall biosynthesis